MTPEAQHAAIAAACGYYLIDDDETSSVALRSNDVNFRGPWHKGGPGGDDDAKQFAWEDAPDYLNDLNAMRQAEATLTDPHRRTFFVAFLADMLGCNEDEWESPEVFAVAHATAAQRAEAFLRTISKWDDAK